MILENIKDGERNFFSRATSHASTKVKGGELKGDLEGLGVDRFEGTTEEEGEKAEEAKHEELG